MAIPDEKIAAVMLASGSAIQAAETLGVSVSTLYRRQRSPEFQVLYCTLKADLMRGVCAEYRTVLTDALAVQEEIMNAPEVNPATRLLAFQYLIQNVLGMHKRLEETEKKLSDAEKESQAIAVAKNLLEKK